MLGFSDSEEHSNQACGTIKELAIYLHKIDENGGNMPTNDDHPAHMMRKALDDIAPEV